TQHQTQDLFSEKYQLNLIDVYADNGNLLKNYQHQLQSFKKYQQQLNLLKEQQSQAAKEQDYNAFLLDELVQANLKPGEQQELESQFEVLTNVERVGGLLEQSLVMLINEEFGINKQLYEVKTQLQKLAQISSAYQNVSERIESSFIELKDM